MITAEEIHGLCRRPQAFASFVSQLLSGSDPGYQDVRSVCFARGARVDVDLQARASWWLWPWDPDDQTRQPWAFAPSDRVRQDIAQHRDRGLGVDPYAAAHNPSALLRVVLARAPADPGAWAEALASWLRPLVARPELEVRLLLPSELARRANDAPEAQDLSWFRAQRALAQRPHLYSPSERALIAALDEGADRPLLLEHWAVVADELQSRGDALGESLALAIAGQTSLRERARVARQLARREAARMVGVDKHGQLLAFANARGCSFDVGDFLPPGAPAPAPRRAVQLWAARFGPFVTRLLASSDHDPWQGLGVPASLLAAPELRYLSPRRLGQLGPRGADLSGCDLSGFDLSALTRVGPTVAAVEASLRGCDLSQTDLSGFMLDGADLRGADSDLGTKFSGASFVEARVSPRLHRRLQSWNGGFFRNQGGRPADVRGLRIDES